MNELLLRPMTMNDADFMLTLKNDPETRKFAIVSHDEIKKEDHVKWLENNIQYFRIIKDADRLDEKIGAIRVQDLEVSIWITKAFRNQGIAKKTLKLICGEGMWCKIVDSNLASMRAFIFAGFRPVEHIDLYTASYYIFKK